MCVLACCLFVRMYDQGLGNTHKAKMKIDHTTYHISNVENVKE